MPASAFQTISLGIIRRNADRASVSGVGRRQDSRDSGEGRPRARRRAVRGLPAVELAARLGLRDRVVQLVPLWPNLQEIPKILGATVDTLPLQFSDAGWTLELQYLIDSLKPGTRALYLNSPNNPTGWTVSADEQKTIQEHCRRYGIWIFADDAYERLYYGEGASLPLSWVFRVMKTGWSAPTRFRSRG